LGAEINAITFVPGLISRIRSFT